MTTDAKLLRAVRAQVPEDEAIDAFVGVTGPQPGIEGLAPLVTAATLLVSDSVVATIAITLTMVLMIVVSRSSIAVARTSKGVITFRYRRWFRSSAPVSMSCLPVDAVADFSDGPVPSVTVGHQHLWLFGKHQDEALRLTKLPSTTS